MPTKALEGHRSDYFGLVNTCMRVRACRVLKVGKKKPPEGGCK